MAAPQPTPCQAFRDPNTFNMVTEATTVAAETFVNEFYAMFDSDRISFPNMFRADSKFIWDGNYTQITDLATFLSKTPLTQHKMLCFDTHPVMLTPDDNDQAVLLPTSTILITVQGDLSYGLADFNRGFQHTFVLKRDLTNPNEPQLFYCASFNARLHKETLSSGYKGRNNNNNQGNNNNNNNTAGVGNNTNYQGNNNNNNYQGTNNNNYQGNNPTGGGGGGHNNYQNQSNRSFHPRR